MRIHPSLTAAQGLLAKGALAIGNFDGVHLGHRALFQRTLALTQATLGPRCALTFEPHPARVLAPDYAPPLIGQPSRKQELIAEQGVEELVVQPFDPSFAALAPGEFVERLAATAVATVVVGHDFTYGRARAGNCETLRAALGARGIALSVVDPVTANGLVVSSTKVREFVLEGRLEAAALLLGRPYDLDGEVVRGDGRGRTLGWPTANLRSSAELLPAMGVYAVRARLRDSGPGEPERFGPPLPGAANLGVNPTFRASGGAAAGGKLPLLLEVHLLDFAADLYGRTVRLEFVQRLREERRFPGPDALKAQIAADVDQARRLLRG